MTIKKIVKSVFQKTILSGPVYAGMRRFSMACEPTAAQGARGRMEALSPHPCLMCCDSKPMPEPTVDLSVIVPVYNVERFVDDCICSILSQELCGHTLELIAVNDGSTDGSGCILRKLAACDARMRVIDQENQGLSGARNTGLDLARGRYIAFVDSDDMLAPGHLAALLAAMGEGGADVVASRWQRLTEEGVSLGIGEPVRTSMAPWGRLYKREVWSRLRFPLGCWYEDLITPCCIQPQFSESFIEDAGYLYRIRSGSIVDASLSNPKALDTYWVLEELLGWRRSLGITLTQADLNRLLPSFGPTLLARVTFLDVNDLRVLFSLLCDLFATLDELSDAHTSRGGAWSDVELALRERKFELWCLACAAVAAESRDVKIMTALSYFHAAMGQR